MSSNRLPWYRRFVNDWRGGTRGMSLELKGFYSELLDAQWDAQGQLPLDVKKLAMACDCNPRSVRKLLPELIACGKIIKTAVGYYNPRMMADILNLNTVPTGGEFDPVSDEIQTEVGPNSSQIPSEFDLKVAKNPMFSTREVNPEPEPEEEPPSVPLVDQLPRKARLSDRGTRLEVDWSLPDKWRDWTRTNCPLSTDESVNSQADAFRDFWISKPGKDGRKTDWEATWRNWCRRSFASAPVRPYAGRVGQPAAKPTDPDPVNGVKWGWWRPKADNYRSWSVDKWEDALKRYPPNGTWPWWQIGPPPGDPECLVPAEIVNRNGWIETYRGQITH